MYIIESFYNSLSAHPSDINEHLPTLKKYAEMCDHVTEMGVRYVVSTIALVYGKPKTLVSIDLFHPSHYGDMGRLNQVQEYAKNNNIDFKFVLGNTLEIDIEPTDLLFIDTLHKYGQLKKELERQMRSSRPSPGCACIPLSRGTQAAYRLLRPEPLLLH